MKKIIGILLAIAISNRYLSYTLLSSILQVEDGLYDPLNKHLKIL